MANDIRFKNLKNLISEMIQEDWMINSFPFKYKNNDYIVLLTLYEPLERKPVKYAVAKIEIVDARDSTNSIKAYCNYSEVNFNSVKEFCTFFNVSFSDGNRDLFIDFAKIFSNYIPNTLIKNKTPSEHRLLIRNLKGEDPDAIYCYDIHRNGKNKYGENNKRSSGNSQKACLLRNSLYERFKKDTNLSFYFSKNPSDEKKDEEIILQLAKR